MVSDKQGCRQSNKRSREAAREEARLWLESLTDEEFQLVGTWLQARAHGQQVAA